MGLPEGNGVEYMVAEDWTPGGEHTMQHTDDVS